jgi:glycosyltransferase involved in cell wall biosynthesis
MPFLTFIMPVKDVKRYIEYAIEGVTNQPFKSWELIIVDDHSRDGIFELIEEIKKRDSRIHLLRNQGSGLIQALNTGYSMASGQYIKMIDGDDLLLPSFGENLSIITAGDTTYHNGYIVNENLKRINIHYLTSKFKDIKFDEYIKNISVTASPPRWAWTISKEVADIIFPLPVDLPSPKGGDIYISLTIKKNKFNISYVRAPLYLYRQRRGQVYGGIYNYEKKIVIKRALSMLRIFNIIEKRKMVSDIINIDEIFTHLRIYYGLLAKEELSFRNIISGDLGLREKIKLTMIRKFPNLSSFIAGFKSRFSLKNYGRFK